MPKSALPTPRQSVSAMRRDDRCLSKKVGGSNLVAPT